MGRGLISKQVRGRLWREAPPEDARPGRELIYLFSTIVITSYVYSIRESPTHKGKQGEKEGRENEKRAKGRQRAPLTTRAGRTGTDGSHSELSVHLRFVYTIRSCTTLGWGVNRFCFAHFF